ncbi:hypothetical protein BA011_37085 (plasmid) [Rhizobium leguminosarum]|uniref:Uncharacterized protein n=1 Tax=Rhizobium leguminosarum TaxID=384 RepID=A0A1B1CLI2_RHILE|nr:hypothetical protein BA011_32430 [Rhizobium leguminosarum]ANP91688.1 hypothetical protein BA011_37085 [Rhizobium leguminosarum]
MKMELTPFIDLLFRLSRTALFAKPVAITSDGDHCPMVQQAVQYCGGDDRVSEDAPPLSDRSI